MSAFSGNKLYKEDFTLVIPDSVTTLGDAAFTKQGADPTPTSRTENVKNVHKK